MYYTRIPRPAPTAVTEPARGFKFHAPLPNPFRSSTTLRFDVPASGGRAKLEVFDVGGRHVSTLVDGWLPGGAQVAQWNGTGGAVGGVIRPGVYLCRLEVAGNVQTRRLLRLQ